MIRSELAQRMAGVALFLLSIGFTGWNWYTAMNRGYYYEKVAFLFPAFAVIALGLILFPVDADELMSKYGVTKIQNWDQMPKAWKILVGAAVVAAIANGAAMSRMQVGT